VTLKDISILSILLMTIGFLSNYFPLGDYQSLFQIAFNIGVWLFIFSYFMYALKCWEARRQIYAILMIAIPLLVYFMMTNEISGSILTILFYLAFIFCVDVIISVILLYLIDIVKTEIEKNLINKRGSHRYFYPQLSYTILGLLVVSILVVNSAGTGTFTNNMNNALQSAPNSASNSQYTSPTPVQESNAYSTVQTPQPNSINVPNPFATENYETGLISKSYPYILRGQSGTINFNLYTGIYNQILSEGTPASCTRYNGDTSPCTNDELLQSYLTFINEPNQQNDLDNLVNSIKAKTSNQDDQARIAISLVQKIPYDYAKLSSGTGATIRYPYETLYDDKGICEEKSLLLAYLLRGLGYGVVLFEYPTENHMAIGIKSPAAYAYKNTGYAFVETTEPTIITDDQEDYVNVGKLTEFPNIYTISDGISFNSVSEEFQDAAEYIQLENGGTTLPPEQYRQWQMLVWKYGLIMSDGTTITENPSNKPLCNNNGILCNGECYNACPSGSTESCTPSGVTCIER
jgi:hypothetical protein